MQVDPRKSNVQRSKSHRGKKTKRRSNHGHQPTDSVGRSRGNHKAHGRHDVKAHNRRHNRAKNAQHIDDRFQTNLAGSTSLAGSIGVQNLKYPDGRWDSKALATKALIENGLETEYPQEVLDQVAEIVARVRPSEGVYVHPEDAKQPWVRDMTHVPLVSVDNGTLWTDMDPAVLAKDPEANVSSRDIDQLQSAKRLENGDIRMTIAVSDVDAFVKKDTPLDKFMNKNTSSVYTPDKVFNLIPPELAEDIVSLNPREERLATIIEYTVTPDGKIKDEDVFQGIVKSRTKLDYSSVGAWLEGNAEPSPAMKAQGDELLDNLRAQAEASARIEKEADKRAPEFDREESRIIMEDGNAIGVEFSKKTVANEMVENFMVTTNVVMGNKLRSMGYAILERTVPQIPKSNWKKMKKLAKKYGQNLPSRPSGPALARFVAEARKRDPEGSSDLTGQVIRLIGRGAYEAIGATEELIGHFALGVKGYTQCTASIRRGGDRIAHRMLKAALAGNPAPYTDAELKKFAENLNKVSQQLKKAERMAEKMVAGTMLEDKVGQSFEAVVTYSSRGRAYCRISNPPVEGMLRTDGKVERGDKITVKLSQLNIEKGHIDFQQTGRR